jgi:hypothetical protein
MSIISSPKTKTEIELNYNPNSSVKMNLLSKNESKISLIQEQNFNSTVSTAQKLINPSIAGDIAPARIEIGEKWYPVKQDVFNGILSKTLTQSISASGYINQQLCSFLAPLLAHELYRKGIPYRHVDKLLPDDLASKFPESSVFHTHLRVPIKDGNSTVWKVVDPTIGQFFNRKNGAPRLEGGFHGMSHGIGLYSYDDLIKVFEKNIDNLDKGAEKVLHMLRTAYPERPYDSNKSMLAKDIVNVLYGPPNAVGEKFRTEPKEVSSWSPTKDNKNTYYKVYNLLSNYYKSNN